MGEIDPSAAATDGEQDEQWAVFITLDSDGPESGLPLGFLTKRNMFDDFQAAVDRAIAVRENPADEVDADLDPGQSVNVEVKQYSPSA